VSHRTSQDVDFIALFLRIRYAEFWT